MSDRQDYTLKIHDIDWDQALQVLQKLYGDGLDAEIVIDAVPHPLHVVPLQRMAS